MLGKVSLLLLPNKLFTSPVNGGTNDNFNFAKLQISSFLYGKKWEAFGVPCRRGGKKCKCDDDNVNTVDGDVPDAEAISALDKHYEDIDSDCVSLSNYSII